eukprot:1145209-Pelagomonas_calceolata.AAC.2
MPLRFAVFQFKQTNFLNIPCSRAFSHHARCRIPRDPRILRLTGRHPLNCEPPMHDLMAAGFITPPSIHYVRNHGPAPRIRWEEHRLQEFLQAACNTAAIAGDQWSGGEAHDPDHGRDRGDALCDHPGHNGVRRKQVSASDEVGPLGIVHMVKCFFEAYFSGHWH